MSGQRDYHRDQRYNHGGDFAAYPNGELRHRSHTASNVDSRNTSGADYNMNANSSHRDDDAVSVTSTSSHQHQHRRKGLGRIFGRKKKVSANPYQNQRVLVKESATLMAFTADRPTALNGNFTDEAQSEVDQSAMSALNDEPSETDMCYHQFRHDTDATNKRNRAISVSSVLSNSVMNASKEKIGVRVELKSATGLFAADNSGTSDPYVTIRAGKSKKVKSEVIPKTCDPEWNQQFFIPFRERDGQQPSTIVFEIFDNDRFGSDYLGSVEVDMKNLELDLTKEYNETVFQDRSKKTKKPLPENLGSLQFSLTLQFDIPAAKTGGLGHRLKISGKSKDIVEMRIITVKVIEGKTLTPMNADGTSDPYVKVRIGTKVKKTKYVKGTCSPRWDQQFVFKVQDKSQAVVFDVFDKDPNGSQKIGSAPIRFDECKANEATEKWLKLKSKKSFAGELHVIVRIDSMYGTADDNEEVPENAMGTLRVHVKSASKLAAADRNGFSDPFVVCEIGNVRRRTETIRKNLNPVWNQTLLFEVKDIFEVLYVTVYDDDFHGKKDFLGALAIPLLHVKKEPETFFLKDKSMENIGKGEITLHIKMEYKTLPAYLGLVKPREVRYLGEKPELKPSILKANMSRVQVMVAGIVSILGIYKKVFNWDYGFFKTILAMMFWIWATLYMYFYHVPLLVGTYFLMRRLFPSKADRRTWVSPELEDDDEDDDEDEQKQTSKKGPSNPYTLFKSIKSTVLTIQEVLGSIASLLEKIKNLLNWTEPYISGAVCIAAFGGGVVLYFISLRYILLLWGMKKFITKGRAKYFPLKFNHKVPYNEVFELLGRVPNDIEAQQRKRAYPPNYKPRALLLDSDEEDDADEEVKADA